MAASIRDCACCGKAFESTGHGRKYCDKCRKLTPVQRQNRQFGKALADKTKYISPQKKMVCVLCGEDYMGRYNSKYCPACAKSSARMSMEEKYEKERAEKLRQQREERKRLREPSAEQLLDWHDLSGKSLARVDAEAKAFGLSYGQYTSAVRCGSIDQLLRSRGIADPAAVLREIKVK